MSNEVVCPNCEFKPDPEVRPTIWCPECGKSFDPARTREALASISVNSFIGGASLSPKMEKFKETGDPAVFGKPGALDYEPSLAGYRPSPHTGRLPGRRSRHGLRPGAGSGV